MSIRSGRSSFQEQFQRLGKDSMIVNEKNVMFSHEHAVGIRGYTLLQYHSLPK
jgi:hypothetical protein